MISADVSFVHQHRSGWSIGDTAGWTPQGLSWLVWGSNGEKLIRAKRRTKDEAWCNAELQARAVGTLGRAGYLPLAAFS
jgi:hypothetical protein